MFEQDLLFAIGQSVHGFDFGKRAHARKLVQKIFLVYSDFGSYSGRTSLFLTRASHWLFAIPKPI
jgi:hypothetical protein